MAKADGSNKRNALYVEVAERPGMQTNWFSLWDEQDELRGRYGDRRGYPDLASGANDDPRGW